MDKIILKVNVIDPQFKFHLRAYPMMHVQIWGFQLKFVTSYHAIKVKFTNGLTDGQAQATTIHIRHERLRGKNIFFVSIFLNYVHMAIPLSHFNFTLLKLSHAVWFSK